MKYLILLFFIPFALFSIEKINYHLTQDPIDVVIVCHEKDKVTLDHCIQGIKENCIHVGQVFIVSAKKLSNQAKWFSEKNFPFSKSEIALEIAKGDKKKSEKFLQSKGRGAGWYYQQLLKLYASFVIPNISQNVLVLDADTLFMNPTSFLNEAGGGLFCISHEKAKQNYLDHAKRLLPNYQRIFPEYYSVCHHMLIQSPILKDLFSRVERHHRIPFWRAFCRSVDFEGEKGASEYEIYYNFALRHTDQVEVRELKWRNSAHLDEKELFKQAGYHFVSFHSYMQGKWPRAFGEGLLPSFKN